MEKLKPTITPEINEAEKSLNELKSRHPDNALFKDNFAAEIPKNFISIFHYTGEDRIDRIGKEGLKPLLGAFDKEEWKKFTDEETGNRFGSRQMFKLERAFTRIAKERGLGDYNRVKNVVFGFPHPADDLESGARAKIGKNIALEIKIDPSKVILADASVYTEFMDGLSDDIQDYDLSEEQIEINRIKCAKKYWDTAMSYDDYAKLDLETKGQMKRYEILVNCGKEGISPDFIKVAGVIE